MMSLQAIYNLRIFKLIIRNNPFIIMTVSLFSSGKEVWENWLGLQTILTSLMIYMFCHVIKFPGSLTHETPLKRATSDRLCAHNWIGCLFCCLLCHLNDTTQSEVDAGHCAATESVREEFKYRLLLRRKRIELVMFGSKSIRKKEVESLDQGREKASNCLM